MFSFCNMSYAFGMGTMGMRDAFYLIEIDVSSLSHSPGKLPLRIGLNFWRSHIPGIHIGITIAYRDGNVEGFRKIYLELSAPILYCSNHKEGICPVH